MNDIPEGRPRSKTKVRKTLDTIQPSDEKRTSNFGVFGGLRIRGTSFAIDSRVVGWRITILKQDGDPNYECWVRHGQIYSVEFEMPPPWDHQTRFVIGGRAKDLDPSTAAVVLHAVLHWSRSSA
jgi:hypothetical protein